MRSSSATLAVLALVAILASADASASDKCSHAMVNAFKTKPREFAGKLLACQIRGKVDEHCCSLTKSVFAEGGVLDKCLCAPNFFSMVLDSVPNAGFMPQHAVDMWKQCGVPVPGSEQCPEGDGAPLVQGQSILLKSLAAKVLLGKVLTKAGIVGGLLAGEPAAPPAETVVEADPHTYEHVHVVEHVQPQNVQYVEVVSGGKGVTTETAQSQPAPAPPMDFPMPAPIPAQAPAPVPVQPKATGGGQEFTPAPVDPVTPEFVPPPQEVPQVPEAPFVPPQEVPQVPEAPFVPQPPVAVVEPPPPAFIPPPGEAKLTGGSKVVSEETGEQVWNAPAEGTFGVASEVAVGAVADGTAGAEQPVLDGGAAGWVEGGADAGAAAAQEGWVEGGQQTTDVQGAVGGRRLRFY